MAIGTPTSLGTLNDSGAPDPYTMTTGAITPAGALIVACALTGKDSPAPTFIVSGGGLSWTEDNPLAQSGGTPQFRLATWSAPAPAGLGSGITLNLDLTAGGGSTYAGMMSVFYITGVSLAADRVNMIDSAGSGSSANNWDSTASSTTLDNCILIGSAFADHSGGGASSTPTGSQTEIHDIANADNIYMESAYRIVSAAGSYSATGNWSQLMNGANGSTITAYRSDEYDAPPPAEMGPELWTPGLIGPGVDNCLGMRT